MKPDIIKKIEEDKKARRESFKFNTLDMTDEEFDTFLEYMRNDKKFIDFISDFVKLKKENTRLKRLLDEKEGL